MAPDLRTVTLERTSRHVNRGVATLGRLIAAPVEQRSAGTKVYADDGHTYLDCGGFGGFLLGPCHPAVVSAVRTPLEHHPPPTRRFLNPPLAPAAPALAPPAPPGPGDGFLL